MKVIYLQSTVQLMLSKPSTKSIIDKKINTGITKAIENEDGSKLMYLVTYIQ